MYILSILFIFSVVSYATLYLLGSSDNVATVVIINNTESRSKNAVV